MVKKTANVPSVELRKTNREYTLESFKPKTIIIPDYVKVIEKGVFEGLENVVIKTSFQEKPERWEEGWNGDCKVIWGEEITYMSFEDYIERYPENGYASIDYYYYNSGGDSDIYITDFSVDTSSDTIPEYIYGKKVIQLGFHYENDEIIKDFIIYNYHIIELIITHEFEVLDESNSPKGYYVWFPNLQKLEFQDFIYCNLSKEENEIVVPCYIGKESKNVPIVKLTKTDREYSTKNFKPKAIIIPDYVEVIEKGVFDGIEDVIIKTSYKEKPEGWEEGWNGNCEVVWNYKMD